MANNNTLASLQAALKAIVSECSNLPPHLLKAAQDALALAKSDNEASANADTSKQLRETITEMDSLGQGGFGEIAAIAKLALAFLATPKGCSDLDTIARALQSIWGKALDIQNCINATAEAVGCNYVDSAERQRWEAQREATASANAGRA